MQQGDLLSVPFAKGSHTSWKSAQAVKPGRELKIAKLRALYQGGSYSDHEIHALTGWPISSVCSLRNALKLELVKDGTVIGPYGLPNDRWKLSGGL